MKISYNWLKAYIPEIPEPHRLADLFTYHICEVESVTECTSPTGTKKEKDWIFDLGILPNRAHDLLSHHGVARELSGLLGIRYNDPSLLYKTPASKTTDLKINIKNDKCRRYSARIVRNVKVGSSPEWIIKRLESIGQRSINNIVDATNIIMYDCGQPAHAFDLRKIQNNSIEIGFAKEGDELKLVGRDAIVVKLKNSDLIITSGGVNLGLAGVKGGADSGVTDDTIEILIEIANFDPTSVRKTARRIGQLSDSAKRFENDLSPSLCDAGMLELSGLLLEIFPNAVFEDVVDVYPQKQIEKNVSFSSEYISKILGIKIEDQEIEKILKNYSYEFSHQSDWWEVIMPPTRLDLVNKEDMAEEIGRILGYDKVLPILPKTTFVPNANDVYSKMIQVRNKLMNDGYREVMTYAFTNTGEVEVLASASDKKFLRTNLSDGLKQSYELNKLNAPYLGLDEIKIFEIGTVFNKNGEQINIAYANKKEVVEKNLEDFTAKSEQENSKASQEQKNLAALPSLRGLRHGQDFSIPASLNLDSQYFKMWSLYPFITRDIAVWAPEGTKPEILSEIYKEFGTELLQGEPKLVDTFTKPARPHDEGAGGESKTSYAFRLIFQSYDRTLTIEEVNGIVSKITEKLSSLDYEVR